MATYRELEEYYSYDDALDMYEVIYINAVNEARQYEEMKHGR